MTQTQIQAVLDGLNTRRQAIGAQLDAQRGVVQTTRANLIAGTASPSDVAAATGEESALRVALDSLDAQIKDASAQLAQAVELAQHAGRIERAVELAQAATAQKAVFDAAFTAAAAHLDADLQALMSASDALDVAKREFTEVLGLTSVSNPDLELVKAATDASTLIGWGKLRPAVFDTLTGTSLDIEIAFNRAFERRDTRNRQTANRNSRSPFAEPGATR